MYVMAEVQGSKLPGWGQGMGSSVAVAGSETPSKVCDVILLGTQPQNSFWISEKGTKFYL